MGLELAAAIVALTLAGLWVDHRFGTGPKGVIIGAILGVVGGSYNFIRQALALTKQGGTGGKGDEADQGDDTTGLR
jgi:F0F1-type ATP synthase assembly protein I